ncbi:mycofactocin biosynthesis peptidyl-dipeptidase MftE [Streptomyces boluensis]|uniref:Mycofactocin biosynthesis peptidyl-dipeptidase MftE n=1 Tax=Streptomyces boluensis TaxID=1775135 RepID=A0A964UNH2_9ACTN|nr:mycofactocin biosynthesis peptidyl-dipeptidase MftE [Streptomyces boluensis]NBE51867.1 mycofactocin biosynthesis peptidyl-dipeptidase MftE [Streptomyces boluensis]
MTSASAHRTHPGRGIGTAEPPAPSGSGARAGGLPAGLGRLTWPEAGLDGRTLLIPVGSLEQHGPHLPLDTDTRIAAALASGLAARRRDVVVAPAIPYGSSGEHQDFPGTVSVGQRALELFIVELVRSSSLSYARTVLVNGHGGNGETLRRAARQLRGEGRDIALWAPHEPDGDAHAGRTETSLMLALCPELVRLELAAPGSTAPLAALLPQLRAEGMRAVTANGVLGDPTGANSTEGHALFETMLQRLDRAVAPPAVAPRATEGRTR